MVEAGSWCQPPSGLANSTARGAAEAAGRAAGRFYVKFILLSSVDVPVYV